VDDRRRARGGLEQEIIAVLATSRGPMTPAQVRAGLRDGLAYTTVMTVLGRLHGKGLVTRERAGRAFAYQAVPDDAGVTARQMRRLLDAGEDRAAVLSRFVEVLSPADEQLLSGLIHRTDGNTSR
jgi:predicted transcriptional regulator